MGRRILFQAVPEAKTVKNRVHLDLLVGPENHDAEVERLWPWAQPSPGCMTARRAGGRCSSTRILGGGFNPFSASLFVYPVILAGVLLSRRQRVGARFWAILAGGAALFILAVHLGPAAGDSVTTIPNQYGATVADVGALVVLALFLTALVWHCAHELRRMAT